MPSVFGACDYTNGDSSHRLPGGDMVGFVLMVVLCAAVLALSVAATE